MDISIYGTGYVGLIVGVCFANIGHKVLCFDIDKEKIEKLNQKKSVLYEPNLDKLLAEVTEKKNLRFIADVNEAVSFSTNHFMCIGTPTSDEDGSANLSHLFSAIEVIASLETKPFLVIIKSTVPIGTTDIIMKKISEVLSKRKIDIPFDVVSCPEFMAQGNAIENFMHPERLIIGTESIETFLKVKEIYTPLLMLQELPNTPVIQMSPASAELTKYASNLFLATKISFMNEISRIAEITNADIGDVVCGMVADSRIGPAMSKPGCGFGGSCLPKDLKALIHYSVLRNFPPELLLSVLEVNTNQRLHFINKVFEFFNNDVSNKVVAVWGLAFKANTDDLRESASIDLIKALLNAGATVQAYDPVAGPNAKKNLENFSNFHLCTSKEMALSNADLLVVMTDWPEFYEIDTDVFKKHIKKPVLFDGRTMYDPKKLTTKGISYFAIGKGFLPAQ